MKKVIIIFCSILILSLCWFLFIKKYDYQITFESNYGAGTVFQEVLELETLNASDSLKSVRLNSFKPFHEITQIAYMKEVDSIELVWDFEKQYDTITKVTVRSRSITNTFKQRLSIINPFQESDYIQELKKDLIVFRDNLYQLQKFYTIKTNEEEVKSPGATCACVTSTTKIENKAQAMMATIGSIETFLQKNDIKQKGLPMSQVSHWYIPENIITFDFCFPVADNTSLPKDKNGVFIKKIEPKMALYARFNGNYKLSHRAWFDLYEYAKNNYIEFNPNPIEVYHGNPMNGGDPITWQADIYLPLKK
ncbi:MAG: GyrI-like domain-containing protein [Leeuwenhoekiella sp.]